MKQSLTESIILNQRPLENYKTVILINRSLVSARKREYTLPMHFPQTKLEFVKLRRNPAEGRVTSGQKLYLQRIANVCVTVLSYC